MGEGAGGLSAGGRGVCLEINSGMVQGGAGRVTKGRTKERKELLGVAGHIPELDVNPSLMPALGKLRQEKSQVPS